MATMCEHNNDGNELPIDDCELKRMFLEEGMSVHKIAKDIGSYDLKVKRKLVELGVYKAEGEPWELKAKGISIDEIRRLYVEDVLSAYKISEKLGIRRSAVINVLINLGVYRHGCNSTRYVHIDREELRRMYCDEHMESFEIAKALGTSHETVIRRLRSFEIRKAGHRVRTDDALIKKRYVDDKESIEGIAKESGVSRRTIKSRLDEMGVSSRFGVYEGKDTMVQMYKEGKHFNVIAEALGVNVITVRRRLKKLGVLQKRRKDRNKNIDLVALRRMWEEEGMSIAEIADAFDANPYTVRARLVSICIEPEPRLKRRKYRCKRV